MRPRLSPIQQAVLRQALDYLRYLESQGNEVALLLAARDGVPLSWLRGYGNGRSSSDRAAFSRALKQLERRGFIIRTNVSCGIPSGPQAGQIRHSVHAPHRRTDQIILTYAGRAEAERLLVGLGSFHG
jgi:hypothetical protein